MKRDRLHPDIRIGVHPPNKERELVHTEVRIGVQAPNKEQELVHTEARIDGPPPSRETHSVLPVAEHRALKIGDRQPVQACPARSRSEARSKRVLTIEDLREQPGHRERLAANQAPVRPLKKPCPRNNSRAAGTTAAP